MSHYDLLQLLEIGALHHDLEETTSSFEKNQKNLCNSIPLGLRTQEVKSLCKSVLFQVAI